MSTVFSTAKARVTSAGQATSTGRPEPKLRVVYGAPFRPPRMPFVLFVVALLGAGLIGLLLLNTELQRGTFQVTTLNQQADHLRDEQEQLERQVRTLESPQNLADRALRMGMVPNPNPVFLRLADGKVLGVPAEGRTATGRTMFGPDIPKVAPPITQPPVVKPPVAKPPVAKPPVAKPPVARPSSVKPPAPNPAARPSTATPPTGQTTRPSSPPRKPATPATTGARTTTPTGG